MSEMGMHTPLPWCVFTTKDGRKLVGIGALDGQGILDCGFGVWAWDDAEGVANANIVVEAVNNHAALKARVEELEKALESVGAVLANDEMFSYDRVFRAQRLITDVRALSLKAHSNG